MNHITNHDKDFFTKKSFFRSDIFRPFYRHVERSPEQEVTDVYYARDQKFLHKNAFDEGIRLPDSINDIIGYGAYNPLRRVIDASGFVDIGLAIGFAKINSDIHMSLTTPLGTRFMNPEFGSKLYTLLFEPCDDFLIDRLKFYTVEAVSKDVRKIKVIVVNIDRSEEDYNTLKIGIQYLIRNTQIEGNYVYPFVTYPEPTRY